MAETMRRWHIIRNEGQWALLQPVGKLSWDHVRSADTIRELCSYPLFDGYQVLMQQDTRCQCQVCENWRRQCRATLQRRSQP
jgi:hypothetical protein